MDQPTPRVSRIIESAQLKFELDFGDLSPASRDKFFAALRRLETIIQRGHISNPLCWRTRLRDLQSWADSYFSSTKQAVAA